MRRVVRKPAERYAGWFADPARQRADVDQLLFELGAKLRSDLVNYGYSRPCAR